MFEKEPLLLASYPLFVDQWNIINIRTKQKNFSHAFKFCK